MATATATPLQRADELLGEMTLEEKAMQLASVVPLALLGPDGPMRDQLESLLANGVGHGGLGARLGAPGASRIRAGTQSAAPAT